MRRKRIAAFLAGLNREYQRDFARGMVDEAAARDIDLCLFTCQGASESAASQDDLSESSIFDLPDLDDFDGITALCATVATTQARKHLHDLLRQHSNKPQIIIDDDAPQAVYMTFDDRTSVRELTCHLVEVHGYRNFFLMTGPKGNPVADSRTDTCLETLASYGIHPPENHIFDGLWIRQSGGTAVRDLMKRGEPLPDCFICGNDDMAFGVIDALEEYGYRVPDDTCVTGFDARSEAVGRGLTSIRRPVRDAGRQTIATLHEWMNGTAPTEHHMLLETQVVYGDSCGCTNSEDVSRQFVRSMSREQRAMEYAIRQSSSFSNALAAVSSEEDAGLVMNQFAERWDMRDFHVCIDPDRMRSPSDTGLSEQNHRIMLLSSFHDGKCAQQESFEVRSLLPLLDQERSHPLTLVFCPLYYLDHNFGYTVLGIDFATTLTLYPLLTLLGSGLMSMYLQFRVRAYAKALEDLSIHDPLTGLLNRRGFQLHAPPLLKKAIEEGLLFMVLSADMDDMKIVNDRYGHLSGDQAICRMGNAMHELDRLNVTSVHISGDEFVAFGILPDKETANRVEALFREGIERINREDPWVFDIEASVGVYYDVPTVYDTLDLFRSKADSIMYERKRYKKLNRKG